MLKEAEKYGVEFISYADPSGGVKILGPKMTEQVVETFTKDFLKEAGRIMNPGTMLLLCPKITFALLGTGNAEVLDIELSDAMAYEEACIKMAGRVKFAGQMCIKNVGYCLENRIFKEIVLM